VKPAGSPLIIPHVWLANTPVFDVKMEMEWFQPLESLGMDSRTGQPDVIKPF
jgi:hypothetical protein